MSEGHTKIEVSRDKEQQMNEYVIGGVFEDGDTFRLLLDARNGFDAMWKVRNLVFPKSPIKAMSASKVRD